ADARRPNRSPSDAPGPGARRACAADRAHHDAPRRATPGGGWPRSRRRTRIRIRCRSRSDPPNSPSTIRGALPMIETRDLTKMYGDLYALNRLNLSLEQGDVYGFIGPNGAGKTTTMRILATL